MELGHYFGGWVESPSKQTDRTEGGWVQSTFGAKVELISLTKNFQMISRVGGVRVGGIKIKELILKSLL